jgi:hypothetical protein
MQRLEVSGAVRPLKGSLGVKGLKVKVKGYSKKGRSIFKAQGTPRGNLKKKKAKLLLVKAGNLLFRFAAGILAVGICARRNNLHCRGSGTSRRIH